jgi:hypothetical protein
VYGIKERKEIKEMTEDARIEKQMQKERWNVSKLSVCRVVGVRSEAAVQ